MNLSLRIPSKRDYSNIEYIFIRYKSHRKFNTKSLIDYSYYQLDLKI